MYWYEENGKKKYTLQKEIEGKTVNTAHPAHFTPTDKFSKERIILKQRYNIQPFHESTNIKNEKNE
ncbi:hypothetical protein EDEG_03800 [Edhazardia aedis USNM 41457]|uniref:H/ACA ribonucleoprotein complex subunit NOP10 n=1 Tax=Edhazardia aedis (strain USNM 41457) TaxID=1003232 RepID=J9D1E6_EDHAE|nr:hypothetical protein EDEG_03800 [Edhazardia aedis USNM 41457]|eukprot:EJW01656.1 hypothetical protein EDEG_03800 [Edhazardia aedis USNM 41457]